MTRLTLTLCLLLALTAHAAPALKPNDGTYDNGPALSFYAQHSMPVPAGVYYVLSTIETSGRHGGILKGAGRITEQYYTAELRIHDEPITVIVWNGSKGGTLLHVQRQGFVVEDITLQGGPNENLQSQPWKPVADSLVDLENGPPGDEFRPLSNVTFNRVTFLTSKFGVRTLRSDHCDHLAFRDCVWEGCDICFQSNEPQSVEAYFDHPTVKLDCKYIFDYQAGGRMQCNNLLFTGKKIEAVLNLGAPDQNANSFEIQKLWLDNVARNVCVVKEQRSDRPALVDVHGFMASQVTTANPCVDQKCDKSRIKVRIEQFDGVNPGLPVVWPKGAK